MSYQNPDEPGREQPGWGQQQPGWGQQPGGQQQPGWGTPPPGYGQQPGYGAPPPGYQAYPSTPGSNQFGGTMLAGWGQRLGAGVIDLIIVFIPTIIISLAIAGSGRNVVSGLVLEILGVLYIGLMVGSQGRTVGMMAVGTACRDKSTGGMIGYGRAFARAALFIVAWDLFFIPWLLNVLWPLWDPENQTISDKIVSTYVVNTK